MSAAPCVALGPYLGSGDDGAAAWSRLAPGERRRTAMQAARDHERRTLWSLIKAWLRTFGPAGATVAPGTVRSYHRGVHALLAACTAQDLLRPDPDAATLYIRLLERRGRAPSTNRARHCGARSLCRVALVSAAWRLLGDAERAGAYIGRDVQEVFARAPTLLALWDARVRSSREIPAPANAQARLEVRIVPLQARDARTMGELLVLRDITERKQAEERTHLLQREQLARLQAEEALRVRADVLATVAHDLKSPLGTVKGLAQLLQRQVSGAELAAGPALAEKLACIDGAATKMARLINELLDVAQLEAGQPLTLEQRPTDLVALAHQLVAEHRARSPAHCLRVHRPRPPGPLRQRGAALARWPASAVRAE